MEIKYTEENGRYCINCTEAVWSSDRTHEVYHQFAKSIISDVDFIIETKEYVFLLEYKNADFPEAVHPERFNPSSGNKLDAVARKFYDTQHYLNLLGKNKPQKYIYILEYPNGNPTSRRMIRNKLKERLPFLLQQHLSDSRRLIDEVQVMNISEWNADPVYGAFPFQQINEE